MVVETNHGPRYYVDGAISKLVPTGATRECVPSGRLTTEKTIPDLSRRSRERGDELLKEHQQVVLTADVSGR